MRGEYYLTGLHPGARFLHQHQHSLLDTVEHVLESCDGLHNGLSVTIGSGLSMSVMWTREADTRAGGGGLTSEGDTQKGRG